MKNIFLLLFGLLSISLVNAQREFHVFPTGKSSGNGSLLNPWDLQTALTQKTNTVNGGDTIWLHEGIYEGQFISTLESTIPQSFITVAAFKTDKVVLNGNIPNNKGYVLEVRGKQVIFKNFDVTCLGDFSRDSTDENFNGITGINHISGEDCQFINLKIYNIPGSGMGSWKMTGGTKIEGCMIYNNGYMSKSRGSGVGLYVQNQSEKIREITNNIIFNNYYKGVEIWSATSGSKFEFVKNVQMTDNVVFNNGSPSKTFKGNVIIASDDNDGINVAKNITLRNNVLYHNIDFADKNNFGDGTSLHLGWNKNAPVNNVVIENNLIVGKNNGLNILYAQSLTFKNNIVYTGNVHLYSNILENHKNWDFDYNTYYTRRSDGFRVLKHKDYRMADWQKNFQLDANSTWSFIKNAEVKPYKNIVAYANRANTYKVVLMDKTATEIAIDFAKYSLKKRMAYKIYDAENPSKIIRSGIIGASGQINFPLGLKELEYPLHNTLAQKSATNFGVFIVEFQGIKDVDAKPPLFKRLFEWFGI
ncbi:right-handed parallel beta-helix repeat-containing protein [Gelidibacter maritimus]|uniref:Right-handed parallel beta-helix repeat-containing protein n=1 Tax=Gelidibacter maritimus TaxID=2761487 RepID=A0A7W2R3E5_9FLAO|nr:hypothetical protein [Gelidibacter maritimus]MBA6152772.1 hypothetical protein [Gelidibacter maritimus]